MLGNYQKYEVTVKFTFESEVFPEDPDDVYELAQLEEKSVATELNISFPGIDIKELSVAPVIGE
ncbi:Hypothetical Protein OBI_RACECAR_173 [Arthrobacter phage Racecar]|nr:hypothetical protein PBI_RACECAR_255 [Arthrobacter phage Racecar]QFG12894.1 hypothetical protein PBI_MIMI_252 [Arthrobacter phage Mimi]